ncbi:ATP-binding cassette domain-containing protein [Ancylobacter sp. 6x-1]|uniref:ATP-binding cassette domain-containing protein n=1 Tax=Ancylobacter crimeensis TaxID=2579147 RepID=A0ABT0DAX0_9HYPH|nr:ATP-binding cassette domain-containing protein [Ancylobacter crimeensis]MCK0196937.1 ATP-binding cassette domain-containing protein [Ancylobacter crimeensis]
MPVLDLRDVEICFPGLDRPALAVPGLALAEGEHAVLTGPSGAGKTTFLNLLSGLERTARGRVAWDGVDLGALSESGRDRWRAAHVGLVMQDFHLFPGLSALENVLLPQRLRRFRLPVALESEAARLLGRVGILRTEQDVATLSRGQMQRVAVARALLARPGIIVADEPTASLDEASGAAVAELLTGLAREAGATLIVASHDPLFTRPASRGFARLLRLEAGSLAED